MFPFDAQACPDPPQRIGTAKVTSADGRRHWMTVEKGR
jgi:hypothetical protein